MLIRTLTSVRTFKIRSKSTSNQLLTCFKSKDFYKNTYSTASKYNLDLKIKDISLNSYINSIENEYKDLTKGNNFTSSQRLIEITPVIKNLEERNVQIENINNLKELLEDRDEEIRKLAEDEKENFEKEIENIDKKILELLLPTHKEDFFNSIVLEVQAGVGGQEAMLFAKEIFEMYCNFAQYKGWTCEISDYITTDIGGIRYASALIDGAFAFRYFKHEAGVHRVQRIPSTEKAGRIHTSTASVVILPQPSDIEINIQQKDLKIETKRSTGAGGQHVNTTDSAVRIVHLPTGIAVECQTDRSQIKNRKYAMARLKAMLYQKELEEQVKEQEATKKSQVRSNNRNEKVRTYNFNQDRITDHRLQGVSFHNLEVFMEGAENLENLIEKLDYQYKIDSLLALVNKD